MKKKNNSWAYGIIASFVIFTGLMVSFAVIASHHKADLVVTDYYKAEIDYQKQIEKEKNFSSLPQKPQISYDSIGRKIAISWPDFFRSKDVKGNIYLYRPDKPEKDKSLPVKAGEKQQVFSARDMLPGKYILKMDFSANEMPLYIQKEIFIKP